MQNKLVYIWCNMLHVSRRPTMVKASQITGSSIVYSTACSEWQQSKHQRSSLPPHPPSCKTIVYIHRWPVDFPHKGPIMQIAFLCHGIMMETIAWHIIKTIAAQPMALKMPGLNCRVGMTPRGPRVNGTAGKRIYIYSIAYCVFGLLPWLASAV